MLAPIALALALAAAQDVPRDLPKSELPAKAVCIVCSGSGDFHGEEKPTGGVEYKGKRYYFCASGEGKAFKKDPDAYLPPVLPMPAPPLKAVDLAGKPVTLADHAGKVVLVDFWATWCKPCVKSLPTIDRIASKWKDQGVVVLGVSIDEKPALVAPFLKKKPVGYPMLLDDPKNPTWKAYNVRFIPALFLIDRSGNVVAHWRGEANAADIEAALAKVVAAP